MQKLINAIALFAGAVSLGFVVTGAVLYANRDAIKATIESQVKDAVLGAIDLPIPTVPGPPGGGLPTLPGI